MKFFAKTFLFLLAILVLFALIFTIYDYEIAASVLIVGAIFLMTQHAYLVYKGNMMIQTLKPVRSALKDAQNGVDVFLNLLSEELKAPKKSVNETSIDYVIAKRVAIEEIERLTNDQIKDMVESLEIYKKGLSEMVQAIEHTIVIAEGEK
ncbi:MAG TPA: hypothetical protein DDX98_01230 [Bacteroidales bacterium]|jgi:hypothetical protein|nr:hypothetical protein [Bacteroidales bacterium]